MSTNQFREFVSAVVRQLPSDMSSQQMQEYIEDQAKLAAALRNGLIDANGITEIELKLKYRDGIIVELRNVGGPWGYCNEQINDNNYPTKGEDGVVRYCLVS